MFAMDNSRSWMFVPGHIAKMVDKALGLPVDALMLDIEDGVLPAFKQQARSILGAALAQRTEGPRRFVRINAMSHPEVDADLDAIVVAGCDGVVAPKVETVDEVRALGSMLERLEQARGVREPLQIVVAIESALGLLRAAEIARASPRVCALILGAEDLAKDLGLPIYRQAEAHELLYARSTLVVAAAAARIQSIDQVWPDIKDEAGLRRDAAQARRLGFTGKSLIHPAQIAPVNEAFSPTPEDLDFAERVVAAFKDAEAKGLGSVAFGGQLLDKPIVDRARATLALGARLAAVATAPTRQGESNARR
jgi:citrate lyase subunit beta/citryl-CoA lyase